MVRPARLSKHTKRGVLLEVCCGSFADAWEAQQGGADRVELCSALFLGGLTPSLGTIVEARTRLKIPVMVMVRPRSGGFCYSKADFAVVERDLQAAVELGADGVVFGVLRSDGRVDAERCARLCQMARNKQTVFHRAFDLTPDPIEALDTLIELGITRVLTTGQQTCALDGADMIRRLLEHARGRIEVLPGGGIRRTNVRRLLRETGCTQVHLTAFKPMNDPSSHSRPELRFGDRNSPPEGVYQLTHRETVRAVVRELRQR